MSPNLARKLKLQGEPSPLLIEWADRTTRRIQNSITVHLNIRGVLPQHQNQQIVARTMDINLPRQSMDATAIGLPDIETKEISSYIDARPDILIGVDNTRAVAPDRTSLHDNLLASRTPLGWTIEGTTGNCPTPRSNETQYLQLISLVELHNTITNFIENDSLGIDPKRPVLEPTDIQYARRQLEQGLRRLDNGYEMKLMWKNELRPGPSNRGYAVKRLVAFEKQMQRNPKLREAATKTMDNYRERGYITEVIPVEGETSWYLPLFAVIGADKIRLIWDAAAKFQGMSLNGFLPKGPDLNEALWNILYRFREHAVAICADVSEMYHRIRTAIEDRKFQRFLWRDNPNDRVIDYEMRVQTFGAVSSPCIAQYVKNENARRFQEIYPEAVFAVTSNTYVDDWVQSCRSNEEAIRLATQVIEIQQAADFHLHKWMSNSPEVLQGIEGGTTTPLKQKDLHKDPKALGINWNTIEDMFNFHIAHLLPVTTKRPTKREMLSLVMSLFDPLGLVAHKAIIGRLIVRETWKVDCDWDDTIPTEVNNRWEQWISELRGLAHLRIPRWVGLSQDNREIHVFVDASERAMAAVAYTQGVGDERHIIRIAASKCKLAPLSQQRIPRLELQAAVLGVRLAEMIRSAASTPLLRITFWTDAMNTLWWINSSRRRYKPFVALRIAEILSLSSADNWT